MSQLLFTGSTLAQDNNRQNTPTEITGLIDNLKKADEFNRDETIDSLVKLGSPAVPALIEALQSDIAVLRVMRYFRKAVIPAQAGIHSIIFVPHVSENCYKLPA